jgi:hypothetical protein
MFLFLLLNQAAHAVPLQLTQQGRLIDPAGSAVTGLHDIHFRIYDEASSGVLLWEESIAVNFANGYYAAVLGTDEAGNPLDADTLSLFPLFMELELDTNGPMAPRQPIHSAPYAQLAGTSKNLEGGSVDATSVHIGGLQVIDSTGNWTGGLSVDWSQLASIPGDIADGDDNTQLGGPDVRSHVETAPVDLDAASTIGGLAILTDVDDQDTLGGLACSVGGLAGWDGSAWTCVSDNMLDEQGVEDAVTNGAIDLHADSTIGGLAILTDADDDDSFADLGLSCVEDGDVAIWDAGSAEWYCGPIAESFLSESEVEGYITDSAIDLAAESSVDGEAILTEPTGGCSDGQMLVYSLSSTAWICGTDTDITLSPGEVQDIVESVEGLDLLEDAAVDGSPILTEDSTLDPEWEDIQSIPSGFSDGTDDVLDEQQVEDYIFDEPVDLPEGSTLDGEDLGGGLPAGVVVMWSGDIDQIPEGWALCDGNDGTPDLRDRFVLGAGDTMAIGDSGGNPIGSLGYTTGNAVDTYGQCGTHCGGLTVVTSVTGVGGDPSYYALAYIVRL